MIQQRHPTERVTPVEVGEPVRWRVDGGAHVGTTEASGRVYLVAQVEDVWEAAYRTTVLGHVGPRAQVVHLRYCQTLEAAQRACQDAEHRRAWEILPGPARDLLLGTHGGTA